MLGVYCALTLFKCNYNSESPPGKQKVIDPPPKKKKRKKKGGGVYSQCR